MFTLASYHFLSMSSNQGHCEAFLSLSGLASPSPARLSETMVWLKVPHVSQKTRIADLRSPYKQVWVKLSGFMNIMLINTVNGKSCAGSLHAGFASVTC